MIERIQTMIEHAACAMLAASVAFAVQRGLGRMVGQPQLLLGALCLAAAVYILSSRLLFARRLDEPRFSVPGFEPSGLDAVAADELLLTSDMVHVSSPPNDDEPLVLDDILAQLEPNSRVVRLFDPSAMPTPGRLKAKIDHHLERGRSPQVVPDASQALSEALAELRRSLR